MPNSYALLAFVLLTAGSSTVVGAPWEPDSTTKLSANHTLSPTTFNRGIQVNPLGLIQGHVPSLWVIGSGSEPNRRYDTYLRGIATFEGARQPLYVVDGVPGIDPALVAPADVARMRVLTDPASLVRYGARAANGVIEIETKKTESGAFRAVYEGQSGVQYQTRSIAMLSADEFRARLTPNFQRFDEGATTNWQEAISRQAFQHTNYLGASGQYNNLHISGSLNYVSAPGVIRHNALNRLSGRLTVSGPTDRDLFWQVSGLGRSEKQLPLDNVALILAQNGLPTIPIYQPDGSFTPYSSFDGGNPVARLAQVDQSETIRQGQLQAYARYRIDSRLQADGRLSRTSSTARFSYDDRPYTQQGALDYRLSERVGNDVLELNLRYANARPRSEANARFGVAVQQAATRVQADVTGQPLETNRTNWRLWSVVGEGEWGGLNRHLWLRGAVRADGSTRFGNGALGWTVNPGVTAEWRLFRRVKSSVEESENASTVPTQPVHVLTLFAGANIAANQGSFLQSDVVNAAANLQPETQRLLNAGARVMSRSGRWMAQFAIFDRFTNNAYWLETAALTPQITNRGQIRNAGSEWRVAGTLVQLPKVRWDAEWVGSFLYNRIESMGPANYRVINGPVEGRGLTGQNTYIVQAGVPLYMFYSYTFAGVSAQGKYGLLDLNRDGRITADGDRNVQGRSLPRWQIGIRSTITAGRFQLSGLIDGLSGHNILNATQMNVANLIRFPINNVSREALQTRLNDYTTFTSQYIESGRFLRLNYLSMAYQFGLPQNHSLTVSATIQNVLLSTGYNGPDPEAALAATPFGHDNRVLAPNAATGSLGLRFNW